MSRIHYRGTFSGRAVCRTPGATRFTDTRRSVTCRKCRVWLHLVFPRPRNLPLTKRKLHFYGPGLDEITARCGMYNHMGLITGKMAGVTCGRCRRLLGLRAWKVRKIRPNSEVGHTTLSRNGATIAYRLDLNTLRRLNQLTDRNT